MAGAPTTWRQATACFWTAAGATPSPPRRTGTVRAATTPCGVSGGRTSDGIQPWREFTKNIRSGAGSRSCPARPTGRPGMRSCCAPADAGFLGFLRAGYGDRRPAYGAADLPDGGRMEAGTGTERQRQAPVPDPGAQLH